MYSALFILPCWVYIEEHSTVQVALLAVQDERPLLHQALLTCLLAISYPMQCCCCAAQQHQKAKTPDETKPKFAYP